MNTRIQTRVSAGLALVATLANVPAVALAEEEERSGIALLVPALAELIPATIAFCIIFVLLSKLAWPAITKMMEDRENKIQGDIDAAEQAKVEAQANAATYEQKLADAQREADEIIAQARRDAENERSAILAEAQKDAAATIAKAKDAVANERKKAMIELSSQVVDLSVDIASKIIGEALSADEQRELAERYLQEVTASDGR